VRDVRVGRHLVVDADAKSAQDAERAVREMCERLLANPVTEDFEIASVEEKAA
jgi:phosphoribosylformylglycinamidine synthase PurS subunit